MKEEKEIRIATESMTKELMKLNVGEMVKFPHERYKRNSLKARPSQLEKKKARGWRFVTKQYFEDNYTIVARFPNEWRDEEVDQSQ